MAKESKRIATIEPLGDAPEVRGATSDSESKPPIGGGEAGAIQPEDGATEPQGRIEGSDFTNPLSLDTPSGNRKRGRPPGARNKPATETAETSQNIESDLAGLIASTNLLLAGLLDVKEFADIPQEKNKRFADALKKLGVVYGKTLSPKAAAWSNVITCGASSYGPIAYAIWISRTPKEKPAAELSEPQKTNGALRPPLSNPSKEKAKIAEVPSQVWGQAPIPDGDF
jgi:hypothetical protein